VLSGQTPADLADDCRLVPDTGRRATRSADVMTFTVPWTQNSYGVLPWPAHARGTRAATYVT